MPADQRAATARPARPVEWVQRVAGGGDRLRVVATLAAVLALDAADKGMIGATAIDLEGAFSIGKTQIGLLLTVTSLVGAIATLPFGVLVDRVRRTRLLMGVITFWGVAMLAGAAATSYLWLLLSRVALGALTAAALPAVASLIGDWFDPRERGRILGLVLAGELVGTGFGIAVSGGIAGLATWRGSFAALAVPALGVGWLVHRLDEPARGGADRLVPIDAGETPEGPNLRSLVREAGVGPVEAGALADDPARLPLWSAVRRILEIRTNLIVIVSSALGYYLFAGVRAFGIEFADKHYGVGQATASTLVFVLGGGAVVGVIAGGRVSDRLLAHGRLDARIVVPAIAYIACVALLTPAIITTTLLVALPLLVASGFFLAVANPPLDAARLDVVPPGLWGRAEATRAALRTALEGMAPLVFGAVAEHLFGGTSAGGLTATFLIMLVPALASGLVLLLARRTYLGDVAIADAAAHAHAAAREHDGASPVTPPA